MTNPLVFIGTLAAIAGGLFVILLGLSAVGIRQPRRRRWRMGGGRRRRW